MNLHFGDCRTRSTVLTTCLQSRSLEFCDAEERNPFGTQGDRLRHVYSGSGFGHGHVGFWRGSLQDRTPRWRRSVAPISASARIGEVGTQLGLGAHRAQQEERRARSRNSGRIRGADPPRQNRRRFRYQLPAATADEVPSNMGRVARYQRSADFRASHRLRRSGRGCLACRRSTRSHTGRVPA